MRAPSERTRNSAMPCRPHAGGACVTTTPAPALRNSCWPQSTYDAKRASVASLKQRRGINKSGYGGQPREIAELRLSFRLELRVSVAGLFCPEFPGKISATCSRRDPRAGLRRDARGLVAAFVLFLSAHRTARSRSAPSCEPGRGGASRSSPAPANRHGGWGAGPGRRNEVLYPPAVSP